MLLQREGEREGGPATQPSLREEETAVLGAGRKGSSGANLKLHPETPRAAEGRSRTEQLNREERVILAWSWRRVYCHEVTPGALKTKRRALVMRKPACGDRRGIALVTSLPLLVTLPAHSDPSMPSRLGWACS